MNLKTYQRARQYCRRVTGSVDFVHDAYIKWYNKTGQNLFDEPEVRVIVVLKNTIHNSRIRAMYMYEGQRYYKQYGSFIEDSDETGVTQRSTNITPEDYCIANELEERFNRIVEHNPDMAEALKLRREGYDNKEIARLLGIHKSTIWYQLKQTNLNGIRNI